MGLTIVTKPPVEPLTLAEAARQLGLLEEGSPAVYVNQTDLEEKLAEAVGHFDGKDGILQRCLVQQTWDWTLERFVRPEIDNLKALMKVPLPPLRSVTWIKYYDESNVLQTLSTSKYQVDAATEPGRVAPVFGETWPATYDRLDAVQIRFVAGYAPEGSPLDYRVNVPRPIKSAIKLKLSDLWENREAQAVGVSLTDNPAVMRLVANYIVAAF